MISILFFVPLYIIGYVLKYKFYNFFGGKKTINILINFYFLIITIVYTFIIVKSTSNCNSFNFSHYLPFIFTMIIYYIFISRKDGVLIKPFSNTFGYLFSFIIKLSDKFKKLLIDKESLLNSSEKLNRACEIILNKPSICINEFTPYNIIKMFINFESLINPEIIKIIKKVKEIINDKTNQDYKISWENHDLKTFIDGVKMKFLFSELLFLLFLQMINNFWTQNEVLNTKCSTGSNISINTILKQNNNKNKNTSTSKKYIM